MARTKKQTNDDMIGMVFGKLKVLERAEDHTTSSGNKIKQYLCKCECGNTVVVRASNLKSGNTKGCGCGRFAENFVGKKFGKLLVLQRVSPRINPCGYKTKQYLCKCDCGNTLVKLADYLNNSPNPNCGCLRRPEDLSGQTFGTLTVVEPAEYYVSPSGGRSERYLCRCECGNTVITSRYNLLDGSSKSCGCLHSIVLNSHNQKAHQASSDRIIGSRFGLLTVLSETEPRVLASGKKVTCYRCKCDCGNVTDVLMGNLSKTHSCGCIRSPYGEEKVTKLLTEQNVKFMRDVAYFKDCVYKLPLRWDFVILNEDNLPIRLIEFDGQQHHISVDWFGGDEALAETQARDAVKDAYATDHAIPLVRIPYSDMDTFTFEDLFSNKYLINSNKENLKK